MRYINFSRGCSHWRRIKHKKRELQENENLGVFSFRIIETRIFDPRFARFFGRINAKSDIGSVTLVTFREGVQDNMAASQKKCSKVSVHKVNSNLTGNVAPRCG